MEEVRQVEGICTVDEHERSQATVGVASVGLIAWLSPQTPLKGLQKSQVPVSQQIATPLTALQDCYCLRGLSAQLRPGQYGH